jgi:hypothetical protein
MIDAGLEYSPSPVGRLLVKYARFWDLILTGAQSSLCACYLRSTVHADTIFSPEEGK